jgi:NAD(P)-dependent dehydrogenase (short-subunit alcohol dehydrogenase family)
MANKSKKTSQQHKRQPGQTQSRQPGRESEMTPAPEQVGDDYRAAGKLEGKVALITGGDSGIGRAVAAAFAREGADVAIVYLEEDDDAAVTGEMVESVGRKALLLRGDIGDRGFCDEVIGRTVSELGGLDVLVNNAAVQWPQKSIADISDEQLERTFRTNIFAMFYLCRAALPHLRKRDGTTIINTTSVTAYRGSGGLVDYASTKGAIVSFTRSLSQALVKDGIRVNAVAPGPIWTPLIPATFPKDKVEKFGTDSPMGRPGQPEECAPSYVFLASGDSSYITGQVLHPNGGEIING